MKEIKIKILKDGSIESETIGIKGKSCLNYVKQIETLTDAKVINSEFTNEYHEQDVQNTSCNGVQQYNED